MNLMDNIKDKARKNPRILVLPESADERTLKAAEKISKEGFAKKIILLGDKEKIYKNAVSLGVSIKDIVIINPDNSEKKEEYSLLYFQLRRDKDITADFAEETIKNPLFFGSMMIRQGDADAMVAGAMNTTANVVRAGLQIIGMSSNETLVSSCFMMIVPDCPYGENGILAFADAGIVPDPNPQQIAHIAAATANTFRILTGHKPIVAMLSFSTKGSAKHKMIDKVIEAVEIAKKNNPELLVDGELQPDAALVPSVAEKKAHNSSVAGKANVLIFPDLNSGNIAYKLVQRLAKARAYGPLLQGLKRPISDLSRGCSTGDIIDISAITLLRAAENSA